jgi:hypothetical protein
MSKRVVFQSQIYGTGQFFISTSMMPSATRGAFLKNRPPGPPEKLLFKKSKDAKIEIPSTLYPY